MGSSDAPTPQQMLATYRLHADRITRTALDERSALQLYGMLRYFMGYASEDLGPIRGASGKRIRSSILLLVADLFGGGKSAEDLAVAVELFHNCTLIHDDIEDHDELRRGRPTVWKLWGVNHAINAGDAQAFITSDFLLRAATTDTAGARAAAELNAHFLEVIEGQYLDFELTELSLDDPAVTTDAYLEMIRKKTSVLVGGATAAGGLAAGCDTATRDALFAYGESLGMAYQIADDMASVWGDVGDTGKSAHGDISEKKKTYPVLYTRNHTESARLIELYAQTETLTTEEVGEVIAILTAAGAQEATRVLGVAYVTRAKDAARQLPLPAASKNILAELVDTLVRFAPDNHASD